jgi:transposase
MDPGCRTFISTYCCIEGKFYNVSIKYGRDEIKQLQNLLESAQSCTRQHTLFKDEVVGGLNMRKVMKKKLNKLKDFLHIKIKNKVSNLHHHSSRFCSIICNQQNDDKDGVTIIPDTTSKSFSKNAPPTTVPTSTASSSNDVVPNKQPYRNKAVIKEMANLAFGKFRSILGYKTNTIVCEEAYTSKMCNKCSHINEHMGDNEQYTCENQKCKVHFNRDENASKNIYFRAVHRFCQQ